MFRAGAWTDVTGSLCRILFDGPMSYGVLWHPCFNLSSTFHSHLPLFSLSLSLSVSLYSILPPSSKQLLLLHPYNGVLHPSTGSILYRCCWGMIDTNLASASNDNKVMFNWSTYLLFCSTIRQILHNPMWWLAYALKWSFYLIIHIIHHLLLCDFAPQSV